MRVILGCGLAALLVFTAGAAADDAKIDAKKLVGKWEPKEKKDGKIVIEFTKDGKLFFTAAGNGKEFKADGTYKLSGDKLAVVIKFGDEEKKSTRTILKLTDTELVSKEEGKDKEDALVRIKGDK